MYCDVYNTINCYTYLWWRACELDIEDVVLNEWCSLSLLHEFVEGAELGAIGGYAVHDSCHWILLALNDHVFHTGLVTARMNS